MQSVVFPNYRGLEKCTWSRDSQERAATLSLSPHIFRPFAPVQARQACCVVDSVLELVGQTPLVHLARLAKSEGLDMAVDMYGKCEFMNAGGSVKDRIGLRMVEEAERDGKIVAGVTTLIEPTSGNTGIGICLAACIKGYKVIVTMPEKMSGEKVNMMKRLGAEIRRTPTDKNWNDLESHIGLALRLNAEIANSFILDQYQNPYNPIAHYDATAEELLWQSAEIQGFDVLFIGAGTGGTLTGIARKFKEKMPQCKIVAIDPCGSILAEPDQLNAFKRLQPNLVEGIGYDFVPTVLDRAVVDEWLKIDDDEAFHAARTLIRLEGLFVGGSSGSATAGMLKWLKSHLADRKQQTRKLRVAVLLPDSCRNYMSKFMDDDWMFDHGFLHISDPLQSVLVQDAAIMPPSAIQLIGDSWTLGRAKQWFTDNPREDEAVVVAADSTGRNRFRGLLSRQTLIKLLSSPHDRQLKDVELVRRAKLLSHQEANVAHVRKCLEIHANVYICDGEGDFVENWLGRISRLSFLNHH